MRPTRLRSACFAFVATLLASVAATDASEHREANRAPLLGPWGYPLDALDRSVRPGDDFFRYANGGWLDRTVIPPDRPGVGFSTDMSDRNDERIATIIADLATKPAAPGSEAQKIRDLYRSYMDTAEIEKRGPEPLRKDLQRIAAVSSHRDAARVMADPALGLAAPFSVSVEIDSRDPTRYSVTLSHAGLHLPDRSYYLRDDERMTDLRTAYVKHVQAMLHLAGIEDSERRAQAIFDLEKRIAECHWEIARRREADKTYNPMSLAELAAYAPGFPWKDFLTARGLGAADRVVARERDAFPALAALFASTPLPVWRDHMTFSLLTAYARYLPARFADENFAFFGRTLSGQSEQRSRDKLAVRLVNGALDQAVGKIYIERYFSADAKRLVTEMFENLRAALRERIERLTWMSPATKQAALDKLRKMTAKIGYPEKWRDYSGLEIRPDDIVGNVQRARAAEAALDAWHLSRPVDKSEWIVGPQLVNAFYDPQSNAVFVPAGYIQSPLFDPHADAAINYGALGSIIGHEIGHGFDDQGSRSDADGRLRDWWSAADRAAFDKLAARMAEQYSKYEFLPGLFVNGSATLGENIADLAGMLLAHDAYMRSLAGREPPVLDGFTGAQRLFLGRAQARRFKRSEEFERMGLLSGVHVPMPLRVNGVVRNIDEWYEAFDVGPQDKMYLPPQERVRIW